VRLHACSEARPSVALFLASTVSELHRNAHIWNAPHPPYCHSLLVMYAESLCTHQALRQKNHSERLVARFRSTAGRFQILLISQLHHLTKSYPLSRTVRIVGLPIYLKFKSQFDNAVRHNLMWFSCTLILFFGSPQENGPIDFFLLMFTLSMYAVECFNS